MAPSGPPPSPAKVQHSLSPYPSPREQEGALKPRHAEILIVEDNPGDVGLLRALLSELTMDIEASVAKDGQEALRYLRREGPFADVKRPDMVILDLNLPKQSGFEVLTTLRADPGLRSLPVVVLSSSDLEDDVSRAYDAGANAYLVKSGDIEQSRHNVAQMMGFLFQTATLPQRRR